MPYEDVPQRIADGEYVPRSEIIGYMGDDQDVIVTLTLTVCTQMNVMERDVIDGAVNYRLTAYGQSIRTSFITRLEGECPPCPE